VSIHTLRSLKLLLIVLLLLVTFQMVKWIKILVILWSLYYSVCAGGEMFYAGHVQTLAGSDYFTSGGSRLTKAQDKKVLEIAHTIKSKIPLYVAVMNKSKCWLELLLYCKLHSFSRWL
jgi:hypothetical protein